MNIGTIETKETNITNWSAWFTEVILLSKLDIKIFKTWMSRKGRTEEQVVDLIKQLHRAHSSEIMGLWISVITLSISFSLKLFGSTSGIADLFVIIIMTTTTVFVIYKKNKVTKDADLVYQFREEYEKLIRRLNLGSHQKSFPIEILLHRVKDFLESNAEELEKMEDRHGKLSTEAERVRLRFKESFDFYQSFGLTLDNYKPYFPQKQP
ncbi:MAG: hypothetical protein KBD10_02640 [Candidatus Pacebacteria bacterium]|nr:hypothetical protein [Candidatus Paceibacterota bacterium]